MFASFAMLVGGLVVLAVAADRFVVAAARLAKRWGMSPILVGALIIGMGTSSPELVVSILAASRGELGLAIGNVVGSNVANVTLVLGTTAVFVPVSSNLKILRREGLLMLVAVIGLTASLFDLHFTRTEGVALLLGMVIAAMLVVRWASIDSQTALSSEHYGNNESEPVNLGVEFVMGIVSLAATLIGAQLLVLGSSDLAITLGIPTSFVGMTIVAVGTSLPELATSVAGIRRNEQDLVVGNVLGSNLFNALAVAGTAGTVHPAVVDESFRAGSITMVICAAIAGVLAFTGRTLVRWEGLLLLAAFTGFVYMTYV